MSWGCSMALDRNKFVHLSEGQKKAFKTMYEGDGNYTITDIGRRFGINGRQVAKWAKALGLKMRGAGPQGHWGEEEA